MFSFLFSVLSFLLLLSHSVTAAPLKPVEFLAVAPKVTSPAADSTWPAGSYQTVSWDISKIPKEAQNYVVTILLGHRDDGSTNENLDIQHPLATQIPIMSGNTLVYVPDDVTPNDNYVVAVIGDSGNISALFTIEAADK